MANATSQGAVGRRRLVASTRSEGMDALDRAQRGKQSEIAGVRKPPHLRRGWKRGERGDESAHRQRPGHSSDLLHWRALDARTRSRAPPPPASRSRPRTTARLMFHGQIAQAGPTPARTGRRPPRRGRAGTTNERGELAAQGGGARREDAPPVRAAGRRRRAATGGRRARGRREFLIDARQQFRKAVSALDPFSA